MRTERRLRTAAEISVILLVALLPVLRFGGWIVDDTDIGLTRDPGHLLGLMSPIWNENGLGYDQTKAQAFLFPVNVTFVLLRALHIPADYVDQVWMSILLLVAGLGMRWFIRAWLGRQSSTVAVVAALGYMFSTFVIVIISDTSMFLVAYALLPWSMGIAYLTVRGRMRPLRAVPLLAFTFLLASATDMPLLIINMAATALLAVGVALASPERRRHARSVATVMAGIGLGVVLLAFSLVPVGYSAAIDSSQAFGNLSAESTALYDQNTSATEVARLQGYWALYSGYADRAYRPYRDYYTVDDIGTRVGYGVVGLAALGLILRRRDGVALVLAVMTMVSARLVIGTHPTELPPGSTAVVTWLFDHVPLMSIFRDTWKFMTVTTFAVIALLAAAVHGWLQRPHGRTLKAAGVAVVAAVLALNAEPAWAGELWWPDRGSQLLPQDWSDAAQWLNAQPNNDGERVLYTPDMPFPVYTWGKPPTDPGEILFDRPQAFLAAGTHSTLGDQFLRDTYDAVRQMSGSYDAPLVDLLQQARVRYVLVRGDVRSSYYPGVLPPYIFNQKMAAASHFRLGLQLPTLTVYELEVPVPGRVTVRPDPHSTRNETTAAFRPSGIGGHVSLPAHDAPEWLVFHDSFHNGWTATATGSNRGALAHQVADRYANGWLVPAGVQDVDITYAPAAWVTPARLVSVAGMFAAIAMLAADVVRRRLRRERVAG
jgi:hypothetical protein